MPQVIVAPLAGRLLATWQVAALQDSSHASMLDEVRLPHVDSADTLVVDQHGMLLTQWMQSTLH